MYAEVFVERAVHLIELSSQNHKAGGGFWLPGQTGGFFILFLRHLLHYFDATKGDGHEQADK